MRRLPSAVATVLWCVIALGSFIAVHAMDSLCLASSGTATWCTPADTDCLADISLLVGECSESSRLNIVIDGLYTSQSSDASANATSSSASVSSINSFVRNVTSLVGSREVLYILEPYALTTWIALSESSRSDELNSFAANMESALKVLSSNANAQVYLGLGSSLPESSSNIASLLSLLVSAGTIQGVVLEGSMGNSVEEIADVCATFRQELDVASSMNCIIDTSTVIATTSSSSSQSSSSYQSAGCADAVSPTADTGLDGVDYFVWLTSPGDCSSDDVLTSTKYDAEDDTESTGNGDSSSSSTASSATSPSASASSKATPSPSSTATASSVVSTKSPTPSPTPTSAASDSSSSPSQSAGQNDDLVSSSAASAGSSASSDSSTSSTSRPTSRSSSSRSSGDSGASSSTSHPSSSATTDYSTARSSASSASSSNEANAYSAKRSDGNTSSSGSTTSTAATTVGSSTDTKICVIAVLGVMGAGAVAVVLVAARRAQQQQAHAPSPPRYRVSSFLSSDVVFLDTY